MRTIQEAAKHQSVITGPAMFSLLFTPLGALWRIQHGFIALRGRRVVFPQVLNQLSRIDFYDKGISGNERRSPCVFSI